MNLIKQKSRPFWKYDNRGYRYCPNCEGDFIYSDNQTVLWGKLDGKVLIVKDDKTYCPHCGVRVLWGSEWWRILMVLCVLTLMLYLSSVPEPVRENVNAWVLFVLVSVFTVPALYVMSKYSGLFADMDDFIKVE